MNIEQLNSHACKTYLLTEDGTDKAVIIDPVLEQVNDYVELINKRKLSLTYVLDTHTHADHISGAAALKDELDCEYMMHRLAPARCAAFKVDDGFTWKIFDGVSARVMYTPGHTRDSISIVFPDSIFTGDALFLDDGGAGRDDLPGGDSGAHWESLNKLRSLPDSITVYPAHDYRDRVPSSLGRQKETNPHLKERTKEEFVQYLNDLRLGPADWMKDVLKANYSCARDPNAAWIPVDSPACEVKGTLDLGVNEVQVSSAPASVVKDMLGDDPAPVLLDVREPDEITGPLGAIDGHVNIPIGSLAARMDELDKGAKIVTVCRSGARAHTAAQILVQSGFSDVTVLEGGMMGWDG